MRIPKKRLASGFELPVFGLGTWRMGGALTKDPNNNDQADITAVKTAIESGITHIDTAEKYADGYAETLLGKAIQGYERKDLQIVTKVSENHLGYESVFSSLNNSLERLRTDYIDLYMIHGPSLTIPIEETMRALNDAADRGLIKNIAVSNFSLERFKEAQKNSRHKIVAGQYHLNLKYREPDKKGLLDYFQKNDVMLIAWRPIQKGTLTDNFPPIVEDLCRKYQKTPSQIAINWLISQKNVVTLSKMSNSEHLKENLGALNWEMEHEDIEKLSKEFPDQKDISDAVPLIA